MEHEIVDKGIKDSVWEDSSITPIALLQHAQCCMVCSLPGDLKLEVERMLVDGKPVREVQGYMTQYDVFLTPSDILNHKKFFKWVCDPELLNREIAKVSEEERSKVEAVDPSRIYNLKQVQHAKDRELLYIWNQTLPTLRKLMDASLGNNMLPVKDYASAYDIILRSAQLLEGKPTERVLVEGSMDASQAALNKICGMVGVIVDEER